MPKTPRLYSLYTRKRGSKRWTRVLGAGAYRKETAIRAFQSRLISGAFDPDTQTELRVVPVVDTLAHYVFSI